MLKIILLAIAPAVSDHTAGFRPATSNIIGTLRSTLHQEVLSLYTHLGGRPAALALELLVMTSSNPLGPGDSLPPSYRSE